MSAGIRFGGWSAEIRASRWARLPPPFSCFSCRTAWLIWLRPPTTILPSVWTNAPSSPAHSPPARMIWEVHIDWQGQTRFVGRLHAAERSPSVSFEYAPEWLTLPNAFAVDPTVFGEVLTAVSAWRQIGGRLRVKASTLDAYASAFEHERMDEARTLLKTRICRD